MASQTRAWIIGGVVMCVCLFVIGILIGHFAIEKSDDGDKGKESGYVSTKCSSTSYSSDEEKYKKSYIEKSVSDSCYKDSCNTEDLPRTYLAYHLGDKTINIDGKLDDPAWEEVPWSDSFVDIRGTDYPKPYFDSKVKVRWDDQRLYVGGRFEETDFWGTLEDDETLVWTENAFEVYALPDNSMHNYKEMQISVRNVTWDLMLKKTYMDGGIACPAEVVPVSSWDSDMRKATFTDGVVNDPNGKGTFWSAEWSFSFEALALHTDRPANKPKPDNDEAWFFIFARPEYKHKIEGGKYVKDTEAATEWWSWQPIYTVNLHLPNRFGLVQFKRRMSDSRFYYEKWHLYKTLFAVFDAQHKYKSINGMFVTDLKELELEPKYMSSKCATITVSQANGTYFIVDVTSMVNANLQTGHIRTDRYTWFT